MYDGITTSTKTKTASRWRPRSWLYSSQKDVAGRFVSAEPGPSESSVSKHRELVEKLAQSPSHHPSRRLALCAQCQSRRTNVPTMIRPWSVRATLISSLARPCAARSQPHPISAHLFVVASDPSSHGLQDAVPPRPHPKLQRGQRC